jgi:hypothetical protein
LQLYNAVLLGYAKFFSRSHHALIRVYDEAGNVIETHEHKGRVQKKLNAGFHRAAF